MDVAIAVTLSLVVGSMAIALAWSLATEEAETTGDLDPPSLPARPDLIAVLASIGPEDGPITLAPEPGFSAASFHFDATGRERGDPR